MILTLRRSADRLGSRGARFYHIPFTLDNTWGRVRVPVYVACAGRPGPTIVAIGGTHGDEYEGPVGLKNLIHELDPARLVVGSPDRDPGAQCPGVPGRPSRFAPRRAEHEPGLSRRCQWHHHPAHRPLRHRRGASLAPTWSSISTPGRGFEIIRCMSFHQVADPARYAEFRETALLFGTPFVMIYTGGMGTGLLTEEAEAMGKITIGSELGYGASTDLDGVRWAQHGTLNVMRHYGLLDEPIVDLTAPGLDRQRDLSATDIDRYVTAPVSGISEPLVPIGAYVRRGSRSPVSTTSSGSMRPRSRFWPTVTAMSCAASSAPRRSRARW